MAVLTMTASLTSGVMTNPQYFAVGDGLKAFAAHYSIPAYATAQFRTHFDYIVWANAAGALDNAQATAITDESRGVKLQYAVTTQNCPGFILILGY